MYGYSFNVTAVEVASRCVPPVHNEAAPAGLSGFVGKNRTEEAGSYYEIVIFLNHVFGGVDKRHGPSVLSLAGGGSDFVFSAGKFLPVVFERVFILQLFPGPALVRTVNDWQIGEKIVFQSA